MNEQIDNLSLQMDKIIIIVIIFVVIITIIPFPFISILSNDVNSLFSISFNVLNSFDFELINSIHHFVMWLKRNCGVLFGLDNSLIIEYCVEGNIFPSNCIVCIFFFVSLNHNNFYSSLLNSTWNLKTLHHKIIMVYHDTF